MCHIKCPWAKALNAYLLNDKYTVLNAKGMLTMLERLLFCGYGTFQGQMKPQRHFKNDLQVKQKTEYHHSENTIQQL